MQARAIMTERSGWIPYGFVAFFGVVLLANALMIWIAVFPTLTVLNLSIGPWLTDGGPVLRTLVLATVAVPIVIYGIMPRLHRARVSLLTRRAA